MKKMTTAILKSEDRQSQYGNINENPVEKLKNSKYKLEKAYFELEGNDNSVKSSIPLANSKTAIDN